MRFVNLEDILEEEFRPKMRTAFVSAISMAYEFTLKHYNNSDFLKWPVGRNIYKELRGIVTQYMMKKLVEEKGWSISYAVQPNAIDNCDHLEILTNRCVLTISQVDSKEGLPRKAVYRNDLSVTNQLSFDFYEEGVNDLSKVSRFYVLLTHGSLNDDSKKPDFVRMGFPKPGVRRWECSIDLLSEPHLIDLPIVEDIGSSENLIDLRDYIKSRLLKTKGEGSDGAS